MKLNEQKKHLRKQIQQQLNALSPAELAKHSEIVVQHLKACSLFSNISWVGLFAAFGAELDLLQLSRWLLIQGKNLAYPRFDKATKTYAMVPVTDLDRDFRTGHYGVSEPIGSTPVPLEDTQDKIFLWLVPGLVFDQTGQRLGRGGGYYDRLLAGATGPRIGVCHHCQLVDEVPAGSRDINMTHLVTEQGFLSCTDQQVLHTTKTG